MSADSLVTLRIFLHRDEAELARLRLEAAGIGSIVFADDEGGLSPGFFAEHRVRLAVRRCDMAHALFELEPEIQTLRVGDEAVAAMLHHASIMAPIEACGLLAIAVEDGVASVAMVYCLTNIDRSPVRFTVAPAEHYGALRHAERNGWQIQGAFHSHPRALPFPSQTDIAAALDPDWYHLIVGPVRDPSLRAFTIRSGSASDVVIME